MDAAAVLDGKGYGVAHKPTQDRHTGHDADGPATTVRKRPARPV
jgi:hypothetical protein